jgi:hypothetical protein
MLEFSFQIDTTGRFPTVREALAVNKQTGERILVYLRNNSDGTFEATTPKYKEIKAKGIGLKGAFEEFSKAYAIVRENYK